jgi:hypothetical protein
MTENNKVQYLPFHALNEFMRDDFRTAVLHDVFINLEKLDKENAQRINRLFAKGVQVPGFRNSGLAPVAVKIKHSTSLFEKSPEFVALIIESWSTLHQPLREGVWQLLEDHNWKPLKLEVNRSLLPGFLTDWPKGDTFEVLVKAFREKFPEVEESDDNVSLMVVWVGNRLPYGVYDDTTP